jgi:Protein of unknown function (DUF3631)
MPKNLKNRVADNWRPLIAIADVRTRVPVAEPRRDTASKIVGLRRALDIRLWCLSLSNAASAG